MRPWLWLAVLNGLAAAGPVRAFGPPGLSILLEARAASARGTRLLLTRQRADGSWSGDPLSTAQVLIALANAPSLSQDTQAAEAMSRAEVYLRNGVMGARPETSAASDFWPTEALAAALTALARRDLTVHREPLAWGRTLLLARSWPVALPDGTLALGFAPASARSATLPATCAALDALLLSEGLEPAWTRAGYASVGSYLEGALKGLLQPSPPGGAGGPVPGLAAGLGPESSAALAGLARALLLLGARAGEEPLAGVLAGLARSPPTNPHAALAATEALSLASAAESGWRERLAETLLGGQQGDGGWAGSTPDEPRDRATAQALRSLQVALGRHLADAAAPPP